MITFIEHILKTTKVKKPQTTLALCVSNTESVCHQLVSESAEEFPLFDFGKAIKLGDLAAALTNFEDGQTIILKDLHAFFEYEDAEDFEELLLTVFQDRQFSISLSDTESAVIDLGGFHIICVGPKKEQLPDEIIGSFNNTIEEGDFEENRDDVKVDDHKNSEKQLDLQQNISSKSTASVSSSGALLSFKIEALLSGCNPNGWVENYGEYLTWSFPDGTQVTSHGTEYDDVQSWAETYEEMLEKVIEEIDGIEILEPACDELLQDRGNLLSFSYTLEFDGNEVVYSFVQFGEGEVAAKSIEISPDIDLKSLELWLTEALDNGWEVVPA